VDACVSVAASLLLALGLRRLVRRGWLALPAGR
jgi:hypothetical protein